MDSSNFIVIYPTYLDSTKTVKVGRRISKVECVEEPSILDLSDACRTLNYRHVVEVRLLPCIVDGVGSCVGSNSHIMT